MKKLVGTGRTDKKSWQLRKSRLDSEIEIEFEKLQRELKFEKLRSSSG
jgi:hypothetical protein